MRSRFEVGEDYAMRKRIRMPWEPTRLDRMRIWLAQHPWLDAVVLWGFMCGIVLALCLCCTGAC